jgi:hypothetical protein
LREVFVFRLRPKSIQPLRPSSKLAAVLAGPSSQEVPIEQQQTERAFVAPSHEPYEAERREQRLVLDLEAHLRTLGHEVVRQRIVPESEARPLFTDLYDATTGTLVEAKGTVERGAIRMAIGQLADYKRFVADGAPARLAILLPKPPRPDLVDLLESQGIDLIYLEGDEFVDSAGGEIVGVGR